MTYDVVVVGARCAGSTTAMQLAKRGYDVVVVDRATFPSDTLSNHYVQQRGASQLAKWGLLRRLERAGVPPIRWNRWRVQGIPLEGTPLPAPHATAALAPRRPLLDKVLVDAAVEAGAEVREGFTVRSLLREGGRVVGVRGRDRDGSEVELRARWVVGADGRYSRVAREVEAPALVEQPVHTCVYFGYWKGVDLDHGETHAIHHLGVAINPTDGDLVNVGMSRPRSGFDEIRHDVEGTFERDLARIPEAAAIVEDGERVGKLRGTGDLPNYIRRAAGPGWLLVGDAAHHKDPLLAQGISDAFAQSEMAADALDHVLAGEAGADEAMGGYARELHERAMPMFRLQRDLTKLELDDDLRAVFEAVGANQRETDRFLGTFAGTVPVPEFWDPKRLRNLVIRHKMRQAGSRVKRRLRSLVPGR